MKKINHSLLGTTVWFFVAMAFIIDPCFHYFLRDGIFDLRYFVTQTLSFIPTSFILAYISIKLSTDKKPIGEKS